MVCELFCALSVTVTVPVTGDLGFGDGAVKVTEIVQLVTPVTPAGSTVAPLQVVLVSLKSLLPLIVIALVAKISGVVPVFVTVTVCAPLALKVSLLELRVAFGLIT